MKYSYDKIEENAITLIALCMGFFHLYTSLFGVMGVWRHRAIHVAFILVLVFLIKPIKIKYLHEMAAKIINGVFLFLVIANSLYNITQYEEIMLRQGDPSRWDIYMNIILTIIILEATRRVVGLPMTIITCTFILYVLFGKGIPGILGHPTFSVVKITDQYFNTTGGAFGAPIGAASVQIIIFILFGAFLNKSGGGDFFSKLAQALAGRSLGGPAKTAVFASALFGTLSGSAVANVATTGAFTIPVMKKNGFAPHFAGAVEAAASTGGQITPPVMGATAFIIAEVTSTPYVKIMLYALFPAILYYLGMYYMVHFEAAKMHLPILKEEDIPNLKATLLEGGHYILAVLVLVVTLAIGMSPMKAGLFSIVLLVLLSYFRKESRMGIKSILAAIKEGVLATLTISTTCAAAGIIVGSISISGLGLKMTAAILMAAGGNIILSLIFTAVASLILGMGMVSISAYVILAALAAPALIKMGVTPPAAHLFVYFFGILSNVTPPVAVAAYTGAGMAGADQTKTALTATKLASVAFIIPFMFALDQRLLLMGSISELIVPIITSIIGVISLAAALEGWLWSKLKYWERIALICGALLLLNPTTVTDIIGVIFLSVGYFKQISSHLKTRKDCIGS